MEFPYEDDTVYLAYCYPYTYSHLQDRLLLIQVRIFIRITLFCSYYICNYIKSILLLF